MPEPPSDGKHHRNRFRPRSVSAPGMLEGRTTKHRRHGRKNSAANLTQLPSPSRSKLTCMLQKAFAYLSDHHWSLEGSRLFCGCITDDPFERETDEKQPEHAGLNVPIQICVQVETMVTYDQRWRNHTEALLLGKKSSCRCRFWSYLLAMGKRQKYNIHAFG